MISANGPIEVYTYEPVKININTIKKMVKEGKWEGSLEQEEVEYNIENNLYSKDYIEKVKKIFKRQ